MDSISELVSDATRALKDVDAEESSGEDDDNEHVTYVARSMSSQETERLQNAITAVTEGGDPEDLVPLADATLFRTVFVTRYARQEVETCLDGLRAVTTDCSPKTVAWAKGAFFQALLRRLINDEEFIASNFSGRKSPRGGEVATSANAAKVHLVTSYAERFAGITPSIASLQRAYTRCRKTVQLRRREKAKDKKELSLAKDNEDSNC